MRRYGDPTSPAAPLVASLLWGPPLAEIAVGLWGVSMMKKNQTLGTVLALAGFGLGIPNLLLLFAGTATLAQPTTAAPTTVTAAIPDDV